MLAAATAARTFARVFAAVTLCCALVPVAALAAAPAPGAARTSGAGAARNASPAPPGRTAKKTSGTQTQRQTNGGDAAKTAGDSQKTAAPVTIPQRPWVAWALGVAGLALLVLAALLAAPALRAPTTERSGPAVIAALPVVAGLGFAVIPFSPGLGDGRWVPVEILGGALFVAGALLGFLYALPVVDPDALKTAGISAGTFVRPGTKLEKVTDGIAAAFTGGALVYALTQGAQFNDFFVKQMGLGANGGPTNLLGIGMLFFFGSLGFMTGYCVTATVGAPAFKRVVESLVAAASIVQRALPFPDIPENPSADQLAAASQIAKYPYTSLKDASEKAAWARAQTVLKHYKEALPAYQDAIVLSPGDAALLLDYATAIYNDPDTRDVDSVLEVLQRAAAAATNGSPDLRRRIRALNAAAYLYRPGDYERAIGIVNDWIARDDPPPTSLARFYRACAFGQLYESLARDPLPPVPPYVTVLADADAQRLRSLVRNDVAITLAAAGEAGRDRVRLVIDPASRDRTNPDDNDLQMLAADFPQLAADAGMAAPPPPPPPHPAPAAPRQPQTTTIPNPAAPNYVAGTLAQWIDTHCPT